MLLKVLLTNFINANFVFSINMKKRFYLVCEVNRTIGVNIGGIPYADIPIIWAEGMTGAAPMFTNRRKALKYAKGRQIIPLFEDSEKKTT